MVATEIDLAARARWFSGDSDSEPPGGREQQQWEGHGDVQARKVDQIRVNFDPPGHRQWSGGQGPGRGQGEFWRRWWTRPMGRWRRYVAGRTPAKEERA